MDSKKSKKKNKVVEMEEDEVSDDDTLDTDDEEETIARIQRAHFAQAAAMNSRRRSAPRARPMSAKRKMEAVKHFHDFTKKLKQDTGITIRSLVGNNVLELSDYSNSDNSSSESDGLSEEEFEVNLNAVEELKEENESYIDPETGDIVESKKGTKNVSSPSPKPPNSASDDKNESVDKEPKTLSISDILNDGELDLSKNVEIAEVDQGDLCTEKTAEELLDIKQEETSQDYDITEKLKEMGEISVKPLNKEEEGEQKGEDKKPESEEEKKEKNPNAINVRRNIREVMDEKNLDASTLAAQRQESERLARVQEQQRIIREVQRQIALNRQNKIHQKTLALLQGGSILKQNSQNKLSLPNTVLMKMSSGEIKKTTMKQGQAEMSKLVKPTTSGAAQKSSKPDQKTDKKEVVEIVSSSSGEESSSSSSDSDDCIMLSDSEVPPSPEADEDPNNSGLHVNDAYNIPDEQGRVLINIGHPENEEDIFLAPQIARVIKPHQIGGVRFLFDNIIESVERFSTSTGFGCILAHSMGLGKTLQIVCFCDIFLRHTSSKTVLCIMPINTLQNWVAEFNMWLPLDATNSPLAAHGEVRPRNFPIYVLNDSHKTLQMRAKVVKDWTTTGGVLMIGYELYRLLSMKKDKKPRKKRKDAKQEADKDKDKEKDRDDKKPEKSEVLNEDTQGSDITNQSKLSDDVKPENQDGEPPKEKTDPDVKDEKKEDTPTDEEKKLLDEMYEALVRPGPDLVICDEGHRIKNSHSNISYALKQMRTKRRVVLTGYPLQNNLLEYWCMVDFVRPNYLGSKTEFCNMFERPIQNGQCIDSTPQDIRLMRYRAHVLHSLLVGFVQRRSHAVLQSTLPQKEEYVLLVRMTPLQRKLYDRFMNEVVRSTSVPNPLKAFAICCKIWNHPDVLYNFLRKRSEANAMIEEDLDLEEWRGVTKAGRARNTKATTRRGPAKPRGAAKKPAATIPPNTSAGPGVPRPDSYGNPPYGPAPYGPANQQGGSYPPYPNYHNQPGYYPPNQGYNQNYDQGYFPQQAPYGNNYPNQYPQNNPEWNQGYQQNNWGGGNYYGNSGYYNNQQYPNGQPSQDYQGNSSADYNNPQQQYPSGFNVTPTDPSGNAMAPYQGNAMTPYQNNQDGFSNPQQRPYQAPYSNQPAYSEYNNSTTGSYPNNTSGPSYPNNAPSQSGPPIPPYTNNAPQQGGPPYANNAPSQSGEPYPNNAPQQSGPPYPNNTPPNFQNQPYPPPPYEGNNSFGSSHPAPYNQYQNNASTYSSYPGNAMQPNQPPVSNLQIKSEPNAPSNYPTSDIKTEHQDNTMSQYDSSGYNYNQTNVQPYSDPAQLSTNGGYPCQYPTYNQSPVMETKPPLSSTGSNSPITSWPLTETLKTEVDKLKAEDKVEMKSESDGEVKIEDLDTKKILKDDGSVIKDDNKVESKTNTNKSESQKKAPAKNKEPKADGKSDESDNEEQAPKRGRPKGSRNKEKKPGDKPKSKAKPRKGRKTSKDKTDDKNNSESEESEKEEKLSREEELAVVKKAEEMTYDWATELLKDYIPGIIENSAKMELFFYLLNESIKLGDRILLFSQSLFTLNLIEDFLERNYIPGTNCLWERNTNYYRLDGSTHALEREKLINEFNANPNIYLFLVSTRAGSLGINLVGANRVIVFDASWNPCHDTQAVCRVYRYGQKKPCFVYRFVMDCCLEKKIYDRQINKQGMADRVVDECNPDAVLSMKEITNLCFDNDEKETEPKDLSEHKDKYIDILMQGILGQHGKLLTKEPFQHESLLVDRKEKKLSSAEKRLAQRGYELEKKAASAPKPTTAYRTVRAADGTLVQRPVASVRPMQHGARWIPADVWRRQGMTAQEMTLPLDVVIPTNSAEKTNIVLKAGQRVMVLKSPKGIYMQLESGKIIAIKTSFKGLGGQKSDSKDSPIGKKILGNRPSASIPGSLKNNSSITITPKPGPRPGFQRIVSRTPMGQKVSRPMLPGQKLAEIRNRLGEMKGYGVRPKFPTQQAKLIRAGLSGSVSITKIPRDIKKPDTENGNSNASEKMELGSEEDTQVLDSDDESKSSKTDRSSDRQDGTKTENKDNTNEESNVNSPATSTTDTEKDKKNEIEQKSKDAELAKPAHLVKRAKPVKPIELEKAAEPAKPVKPIVLTTDEKLPSEEAFDKQTEKKSDESSSEMYNKPPEQRFQSTEPDASAHIEKKINLLKNYRHQRPGARQTTESSLSQLERTAIALNKEGMPDFRRNLDDITQSYSPGPEERPGTKSKKKKSPNKPESSETQSSERQPNTSGMSHSVSSLLGTNNMQKPVQSTPPLTPIGQNSVPRSPAGAINPSGMNPGLHPGTEISPTGGISHAAPCAPPLSEKMATPPAPPAMPMPAHALPPAQSYSHTQDAPYGQYPGYGMGYGAYPNAPYYGGYGGASYYPGYGAAPPTYPPVPAAPPTDPYLPPNPQQW